MSKVAQNGYIHTREVDTRSGYASLVKQRTELSQAASLFDSMGRAEKKRRSHEVGSSSKIPLPPGKKSAKSADTDTYDKLAAAFGAISVAMGRALGGQASVFSQEQQENTLMAKSMLIAQHNQLTKEQQVDKTIKAERDEEAREQKMSVISRDLGIIFGVITAIVSFGPMLVSAGAFVLTSFSVLGDAMVDTVASVTGGTIADAGAAGSTALVAGTEAETAEAALTMSRFVPAADAGANGAATTTDAASTAADAAISPEASTTKQYLAWLGKGALRLTLGSLMGSSNLVQGIYNLRLSKINGELADQQSELGDLVAETTRVKGSYTANQMQLKRESSVLESMGAQSGEVLSTFGDMMRSVREASNSIAYAA